MVARKLSQKISQKCFSVVHSKNLVYNTCWEDPRLDREALDLTEEDSVVVITSAGCNALDYAIQSPKHVFAVDMNPLQNALLELKRSCIRSLDFDDFFQVFGEGSHPKWREIYHDVVRDGVPEQHRPTWDKRINFFDGTARRRSFYFRGTSGLFAWLINKYLSRPPQLRAAVDELLDAESVDHQREIYNRRDVNKLLWRRPLRWALNRDTTMAMLGVPRSQRRQIDTGYPGGLGAFIRDSIETVFTSLPLRDNYFWRVYTTGKYTPACCPEYLKKEHFENLKSGLVDRVSSHTNTVEGFLQNHSQAVTRFVLLDHMDWLWEHHPEALRSEWQCILDRAGENSRVLWRSAALKVDFVDPLEVMVNGSVHRLGDMLRYQDALAAELHQRDRVHTYGSFCIADIAA